MTVFRSVVLAEAARYQENAFALQQHAMALNMAYGFQLRRLRAMDEAPDNITVHPAVWHLADHTRRQIIEAQADSARLYAKARETMDWALGHMPD